MDSGKFPKLQELIQEVSPKILVLQETKIENNKPSNLGINIISQEQIYTSFSL